MYGLDFTFKIIPKIYSPNKLISLYRIDKINKSVIIGCFIYLKYNDTESITKLLKIIKKSINKRAYELLRKIELLCFIKLSKLDEYKKF